MDFGLLIQTLGAVFIGSGAIVYLLRKLFEHLLRRDLKDFEANLKSKHDVEIERLRSDLRLVAFEHETRFVKLHEKRAQVIAELYAKLVRSHKHISHMTSVFKIMQLQDEWLKMAGKEIDEFWDYFNENQIYFDEDLCEKIGAFGSKLYNTWVDFTAYHPVDEVITPGERHRILQEAFESLNDEVPALRKEIENSFRSMIGCK